MTDYTLEDLIHIKELVDLPVMHIDNDTVFMWFNGNEIFEMSPRSTLQEALELLGFEVEFV